MTAPSFPVRTRALLFLVLTNFFWGLSFPLGKGLMLLHTRLLPDAGEWFPVMYAMAPRFLLAAGLILALRPWAAWRMTRRELQQGLLLGMFTTLGMLLQIDGLRFTSASTSAFLTQFSAILIPVWLAWRGRRSPGARVWVCCLMVLAGVAILGRFDWSSWEFGRGEWETLLSSLFFTGQILSLDREEFAGNRPEKITLVMFATVGLACGGLAVVTAPNGQAFLLPWSSPAWLGATALLTLFCTYGAFSLITAWQPKITATEAGLIYCIEPVFASALALFLPAWLARWAQVDYANEKATWTLLVGGGLITLANGLLQLRPPAKP